MTKVSRYISISGVRREVHGPPYMFCLSLIKTEKVQEHDQYLNQIPHHFDLQKKIPKMNKNFMKMGPHPVSLQSEYSCSN